MNASKDTIKGDAIWELLKDADTVLVTSGKKILEFNPPTEKGELLAKVSGRTGNLRAPAAKIGNTFYIGFNDELYKDKIG